jgi:hypothetical protein
MGLGLGPAMSTSINTATLGVDPDDAGVASASVNTMQQVGGSVGTALLSSIAGTAATAYLVANPGRPGVAAEATIHSYTAAFLAASGLFLLGALVAGSIVRAGRPHAARSVVSSDAAPAPVDREGGTIVSGAAPESVVAVPGVAGVVHDDADSPLALAVLTLVDSGGAQADRTVTDDDGRYRLTSDHAGRFLLVTVARGHRPVATHVVLDEGSTLRRDLTAGAGVDARS